VESTSKKTLRVAGNIHHHVDVLREPDRFLVDNELTNILLNLGIINILRKARKRVS
jgi:hypothetical protein